MALTSITSATPVVVTPQVLSQSLIDDLTGDQSSLSSLEDQIASGNQINSPSDDPAGASQILQLQAATTRANQYEQNATYGASVLSLGNSTVNSALSILQSLLSTMNGLSGDLLTSSSAVLSSAAQEVSGDLEQLVGLANTTYGTQPIFAGTGNTEEAYDSQGSYVGAGSAPTVTVAPGTTVAVGVTGPEVFGTGTSGLLSSVPGNLGVLAQLASDLQTGTPASLAAVTSTDIPNLEAAISQVETAAASLGAQQQSMESFQSQATSTSTAMQTELSSVQSVNMAEALTNLQLQNNSYQAALYATSQISADSIVKYL